MSDKTLISWCDATWNFVINCDRVSAGCAHCYIEQSPPLRSRGLKLGGPIVELSEANWRKPLAWNKKPWVCDQNGEAFSWNEWTRYAQGANASTVHRRRVFCESLGDWLNPRIPLRALGRMLSTVDACREIDWLLCTKRPELFHERLQAVIESRSSIGGLVLAEAWLAGGTPPNVWILATAEDQQNADKRIPELLKIPAVVHGLSCEPLLGPIEFRAVHGLWDKEQPRLDWIIVGGESGKNARPCDIAWIRDIEDQCKSAGVPCFVKQLGGNLSEHDLSHCARSSGKSMQHPKGADPFEWPEDLRVRQWPEKTNL